MTEKLLREIGKGYERGLEAAALQDMALSIPLSPAMTRTNKYVQSFFAQDLGFTFEPGYKLGFGVRTPSAFVLTALFFLRADALQVLQDAEGVEDVAADDEFKLDFPEDENAVETQQDGEAK